MVAGQQVRAGDPVAVLVAGHEGCPVAACLHWGLRRGEQYLDPGTALWLGFLPGGGFYVRPGLGVSSLVYPLSIMWVPGKAHAAAELYNYLEFRDRIAALRQETQPKVAAPTQMHRIPADPRRATAQLQRLDKLWQAGRISESEYQQQRQTVLDSMTDEQWEQDVRHPAR